MSEPKHNLYTRHWREARARVHRADPDTQPLFVSLLDHMERGWQAFRPLQVWFEQHVDHAMGGSDDHAHLLNFVDGELSDVFMLLGTGVAELVPGWEGWEREADPADLDGWGESFRRYLAVFRLALAAADVPEAFRELGLGVARVLEGESWSEQLCARLAAVAELVPCGE